jgi:hypothetical protein
MDKSKGLILDKPSIGRIVHYVAADSPHHVPGVITRVLSEERVNIHLWWDPNTVKRYDQAREGANCIHDETAEHVGSWHWPEKM